MTVKQISVFVENKEGKLAEFTDILAQHGVDMRALSLADTRDFGILRLIVQDPDQAAQVLKETGCIFSTTQVLAVEIPGPARKFFQCAENPFSGAHQRGVYLCVYHPEGRVRLYDFPSSGQ